MLGKLTVCVIVDEFETILVEDCGEMSLRNGQTNTIPETLAERTSRDFDTWSMRRYFLFQLEPLAAYHP